MAVLGSVGNSRALEVARAVVADVPGRSASVRVGSARLSVVGIDGVGNPRAASRTVDLAPPDAATAAARSGPVGFIYSIPAANSPNRRPESVTRKQVKGEGRWPMPGLTRVAGVDSRPGSEASKRR